MIPLANCRMSLECSVGTHYFLTTLVTLSLHLWNWTGTALTALTCYKWGINADEGFYGFFKRLLVSPLGRQRSPHHNIWFLIVNIQAIRVAIVSSVITKIFYPSKYWTVTIQPLLNDTFLISACIVYCQFLLLNFCLIQCFCLTQCFLFDSVLLFSIQIIQCIFCSDTGNVFQVFQSGYTTSNKQSLNIIQQTAPS